MSGDGDRLDHKRHSPLVTQLSAAELTQLRQLESAVDAALATAQKAALAAGEGLLQIRALLRADSKSFSRYVETRYSAISRGTAYNWMWAAVTERTVQTCEQEGMAAPRLTLSQKALLGRVHDEQKRRRVIRQADGLTVKQTKELIRREQSRRPRPLRVAPDSEVAFRGTAELIVGDAATELRNLPAGVVSCVVTSPPYFQLRDYDIAGQIGREATVDDYITRLVEVFTEVHRVLHPQGSCWIVIGDSYGYRSGASRHQPAHGDGRLHDPYRNTRHLVPGTASGLRGDPTLQKQLVLAPQRLVIALTDAGWMLRSDPIWAKLDPMPDGFTDRPLRSHEYVLHLVKQTDAYFDADAVKEPTADGRARRHLRTVWPFATAKVATSNRPDDDPRVTMPHALAERCIRAGTSQHGTCPRCHTPYRPNTTRTHWSTTCRCAAGPPTPSIVLDPFLGSGTTALAALQLGHTAIGIDIRPSAIEHTQTGIERLQTRTLPTSRIDAVDSAN